MKLRILTFLAAAMMIYGAYLLWIWHPFPSSAFASTADVEVASHAISNDLEWFDKHKPLKFPDRSKYGSSVLQWLLLHHDISDQMISKLVESGSDPCRNAQSIWGTAARYATITGKTHWVKAMIDGGMKADCPQKGWELSDPTILFSAVTHRKIDIIKLLLENGADINYRSGRGDYPINAANSGAEDIIIYLIDHGAKLTQKDEYGYLFCGYYQNIPDKIEYPDSYQKYQIIRQKAKLQGVDLDCEAELKIRRPDLFEPEIPE